MKNVFLMFGVLFLLFSCDKEDDFQTDTFITKPVSFSIGEDDFWVIGKDAKMATWEEAKDFCDCLEDSTGSNWYLPSKDELKNLYLLKDEIGGFSNSWYWSSTESNDYNAWQQDFGDGKQNEYAGKDGETYFRCIKKQ